MNLPLLSPNTLQILCDFANELTENPPPTDLIDIVPVQTNEMTLMDLHSPIIEQSGGGGGIIYKRGRVTIPNLQDCLNSIKQIRY